MSNLNTKTSLRLIPYPQEICLEDGYFTFEKSVSVCLSKPDDADDRFATAQLALEMEKVFGSTLTIAVEPLKVSADHALCVGKYEGLAELSADPDLGSECYILKVDSDGIMIVANGSSGLFYGVQTLKQLIRANSNGNAIPCLTISDYPQIRWRGYSDDITRGSSPTLDFLKREIRIAAEYKLNFFTFYIEHQFEFKKHPKIGPPDGSLKPEELSELVEYAKQYHIEIIGCFQSFGHFANILKHPEYSHLGESGWIISPAFEESYLLLSDLYSDLAPLTPFEFFNVCCDETQGLGEGPSKTMLEKVGIEGLYAYHINRIYDILKNKYGKRVMMWGDIALQHPGIIPQLPKDIVILDWAYDPRDNFESTIIPFKDAGFEFFVCPGVSCWSRILPDFQTAIINIQHFYRDGAKHGALGAWNTTWDDDGENLFNYNWHGILWGAECSWRPLESDIDRFNVAFDGCFFGSSQTKVSEAIVLLSQTHSLPGYMGMNDGAFWRDFTNVGDNVSELRASSEKLRDITAEALALLEDAKSTATQNQDIIDYLIFGVLRMQLMALRQLAYFDAKTAKEENNEAKLSNALDILKIALSKHLELRREYERLWFGENRPYALSWTLDRFDNATKEYKNVIEHYGRQ
jgi:hypothetical protein